MDHPPPTRGPDVREDWKLPEETLFPEEDASKALAARLADVLRAVLSPREREVLDARLDGRGSTEVARFLGISKSNAGVMRNRLERKARDVLPAWWLRRWKI